MLGVRLIIYLDDLFIMAESKALSIEHTNLAITLLTTLGFVINEDKSVTSPTQELEFLGFLVNSMTMTLSLSPGKIKNIRKDCQRLVNSRIVSVRNIARLLGKLSASIQAIFPAPLHYQYLLRAKNQALKEHQSYEAMVTLDEAAIEELQWWRDQLHAWNGKSLLKKPEDLKGKGNIFFYCLK